MSQSQHKWFWLCDMDMQRAIIQKSLASHVQSDLTGIIVTFKNG